MRKLPAVLKKAHILTPVDVSAPIGADRRRDRILAILDEAWVKFASVFDPRFVRRMKAFDAAMGRATTPAQRAADYMVHGHLVTSTPRVVPRGPSALGAAAKVYPRLDGEGWSPQRQMHYSAFSKSPLHAQEQVLREISNKATPEQLAQRMAEARSHMQHTLASGPYAARFGQTTAENLHELPLGVQRHLLLDYYTRHPQGRAVARTFSNLWKDTIGNYRSLAQGVGAVDSVPESGGHVRRMLDILHKESSALGMRASDRPRSRWAG